MDEKEISKELEKVKMLLKVTEKRLQRAADIQQKLVYALTDLNIDTRSHFTPATFAEAKKHAVEVLNLINLCMGIPPPQKERAI